MKRIALLSATIVAMLATAGAAQAATVLLGDPNVAPTVQPLTATCQGGRAEVYRFTASATGTATIVSMYADASQNLNGTFDVGLYTDVAGKPGTLIRQAHWFGPMTAGGWSTQNWGYPTVDITAGTSYWLGLLGDCRPLEVRDTAGGATSYTSTSTTLLNFPTTWTDVGATNTHARGPASVYLATN